MGALLSAIGGFLLRAGSKVAKKGATKAADAAKKGTTAARTAAKNKRLGKNTPKAQRTPKQIAARKKEAARIRAQRAKDRAKRQKGKAKGAQSRVKKYTKRVGGAGIAASLLGGGSGADSNTGNPSNPTIGNNVEPQQSLVGDDPTIDMSWLPQAMAVSIPVIRDDQEERAYSLSNLIIAEDIEIAEEGGYQFIESGTMIPARIAEIGLLFKITDSLRDQINELNKRMVIANSNLAQINKGVKESLNENRRTKRANERRRDEEDVENKGEKGIISEAVSGVALATKLSLLAYGMRALRAAALGGLALFANEAAGWFDEEEGDFEPIYDDEDDVDLYDESTDETADIEEDLSSDQGDQGYGVDVPEEEIQAEETTESETSALEDAIGVLDASEEGAAGVVNDLSMGALLLGGTGAILGSGAVAGTAVGGAIAATAAGAGLIAAAPVLLAASGVAAAGALAMGAAKYFEVDKKIADAYADWNEEELGEMASREEMNQKYGDTQGTVGFFADLLGEGLFDTEEDPKEIYAAFRDMTWPEHEKISAEYQEEYGKSLAAATWEAVGDSGAEAINNLISENTMREAMEERQIEGDGVQTQKVYATSLESAQEGQYLTPDQMKELGLQSPAPKMGDGVTVGDNTEHKEGDGVETPSQTITSELSTMAQSIVNEDVKFYTEEHAQIKKDLMDGKITGVEALERMRATPIKFENIVEGGVSVSELRAREVPTSETLQLPEVGNIIPMNEILEAIPEEISSDVEEIMTNQIEIPINNVVGQMNSKVEEVVDTTIDEKIETAILPIIRQEKRTKPNGLPAGTQGRSQPDTAGPVYISRDPFIRHGEQT